MAEDMDLYIIYGYFVYYNFQLSFFTYMYNTIWIYDCLYRIILSLNFLFVFLCLAFYDSCFPVPNYKKKKKRDLTMFPSLFFFSLIFHVTVLFFIICLKKFNVHIRHFIQLNFEIKFHHLMHSIKASAWPSCHTGTIPLQRSDSNLVHHFTDIMFANIFCLQHK